MKTESIHSLEVVYASTKFFLLIYFLNFFPLKHVRVVCSAAVTIETAAMTPACRCGVHMLCSRTRISMLNDCERNAKYAASLAKVHHTDVNPLLLSGYTEIKVSDNVWYIPATSG